VTILSNTFQWTLPQINKTPR